MIKRMIIDIETEDDDEKLELYFKAFLSDNFRSAAISKIETHYV